jgi:hypothetical protein
MCVILRNDLFRLCEMEGAKWVRNDKSYVLSLGLMDSRTVDVQCAHITTHHITSQQHNKPLSQHNKPLSQHTLTHLPTQHPHQTKSKTKRNSMSVCLFVWCCAGNGLGPEGAKHLSPAFASMTQMTSLDLESENTHFVNVCDFEE